MSSGKRSNFSSSGVRSYRNSLSSEKSNSRYANNGNNAMNSMHRPATQQSLLPHQTPGRNSVHYIDTVPTDDTDENFHNQSHHNRNPSPGPRQHQPWTPRQQAEVAAASAAAATNSDATGSNNTSNPFENIVLPEVPSPYSPPPASLFSGTEDFPPKSVRKLPVDQVVLDNAGENVGDTNFVRNNSPNSLYDQQQHRNPSLAPAVEQLKQERAEAQNQIFFLEENNKALSLQLDDVNRELDEHRHYSSTQCQDLEEAMNAQRQQHRAELEQVRAEAETASIQREEIFNAKQDLESELLTLKTKNADLEASVREGGLNEKEQHIEWKQQEHDLISAHATELKKLKDELHKSSLEQDRLKALVRETTKNSNQATDDADAKAARFQSQLDDAHSDTEALRKEKNKLQQNHTNTERQLQDEINKLKNKLSTVPSDSATMANSQKIETLTIQLQDVTAKNKSLSDQCKELEYDLERNNRSMHEEADRLQRALVQANEDKQADVSRLQDQLRAARAKHGAATAADTNEIESLQSSLHAINNTNRELISERTALLQEIAHLKKQSIFRKTSNGSDDSMMMLVGNGDGHGDSAVPDRLGRIRDAAERAALVKEYRRELSKLKSEHEMELKRLDARHDKDLKDVYEEAKGEVSKLARENRKQLQGEYESKVSMLERRYQSDLARAQRECDKNTAVVEEAMQSALSEATAISEQLDKQSAAREALELTVREMERKLVMEVQKSKLAAEHAKSQKQWKEETDALIASIQFECNNIFDQNLVNTTAAAVPSKVTHQKPALTIVVNTDDDASSTKSVLDELSQYGLENVAPTSSNKNRNPLRTVSSTFKEAMAFTPRTTTTPVIGMGRTLDDTEAMVRNLLHGNQ